MDSRKFRVWNKTKNEYLKLNNKLWANIGSDGALIVGYEDTIDEEIQEENELIVEWSTGLKDKAGKMIYEGDIVSWDDGIFVHPVIRHAAVELSPFLRLRIVKGSPTHAPGIVFDSGSFLYKNNLTVIGDVHDHIVDANKKAGGE